jgi:uncharacterized protein (UPF0332 family)
MPQDWPEAARSGTSFNAGSARFDRAVSTSYYAVFGAICGVIADHLCPEFQGQPDWVRAYRSIDHKKLLGALTEIQGRGDEFGVGSALKELADILKDLKAKREKADYVPMNSFTQDEAMQIQQTARLAVGTLIEVVSNNPSARRALSVSYFCPRKSG